jgi:toxin ParE1/3/4
MPFAVLLTIDAARDLDELYDYIAVHDSPRKADYVLERIEKTFATLSEFPQRGVYPKELLKLGIREYREVFSKPYRIPRHG